jgi:hypothetical protein
LEIETPVLLNEKLRIANCPGRIGCAAIGAAVSFEGHP